MRYFYPSSRAHHAYAMAIDFGMRFKKRNGFWLTESIPHITGDNYQIEVAEESLRLLTPKIRDLVIARGYNGIDATGSVFELEVFHECGAFRIDTCEKIIFANEQAIIIQRDGKPFMQPEQDDA